MGTRRINASNNMALYLFATLAVIVAFLLLGGWPLLKNLVANGGSLGNANLNWPQILVSLGIGIIIGLLIGRRRW